MAFLGGGISTITCEAFAARSRRFRLFFAVSSTAGAVFLSANTFYKSGENHATLIESGMPIPIALRPDLVGKVIKPIRVVNDGGSIRLVGTNRKLYSLLGVQLESGLDDTNMVDKELIVYKKGEVTFIGANNKLGITSIPTQIGYTNK